MLFFASFLFECPLNRHFLRIKQSHAIFMKKEKDRAIIITKRLAQNNAQDGGKFNVYPRQSTVECATSSVPTASSVFTLVFTL